ncbi:MAG: methyl-accepting chemotaxis protein [Bradyrhizobium sp.]|jgi:methyl-accepting chemotaxis protein
MPASLTHRLTLSSRFLILIGVFALGFLVYGGWSFHTLDELKVNGKLYERIVQGKDLIADILPPPEYIIESYLVCLQIGSALTDADQAALTARLKVLQTDYQTRHTFWAGQSLDREIAALLLKQAHEPAEAFYKIAFDAYIPALQKKDAAAAAAALQRMKHLYEIHRQAIDQIVQLATKQGQADEAGAAAQIHSATMWLMAILALALTTSIIIAIGTLRSLMKSMGGEPDYAADISNRIASGDLSMHIALKHGDQSSMLFAMKTMQDVLSGVVGDIKQAVDSISTGSSQIASGNLNLSARTEAQAGALEETASAMQQLTSTVRLNADNSRAASTLASSASTIASKGGTMIIDVVHTMEAISVASHRIADIIGTIDSIAFQTNILALNAAVEAARAGEQGRGFAVVATEVRNLAQRSASAAREIKRLIGDAVSQVERGSRLVNQTGDTMQEIVESVQRVTEVIGRITQSSIEQATGIEHINLAIVDMDRSTQENAALVEEAAAAAEALHEQAGNLTTVTGAFRLGRTNLLSAPA